MAEGNYRLIVSASNYPTAVSSHGLALLGSGERSGSVGLTETSTIKELLC